VSVAAVAADRSRRQGVPDPLALSLAFPDADSNEEVVQRGVAESLGLEQVMLPFQQAVGDQGLLSAALEVSQGWPAPLFNIWYPAYKTLTAAGAERGAEVIVTGAGGDEWLGVSPFLAADHMRHLDFRGMRDLWKMMHRSYRLTRLASLKSVLWRFGAKPILADLAERTTPRVLGAYRYRESRTGTPDWVAPDLDLRSTVLGRAATTAYAPRRAGSFYLREGQISLDHALVSMEMEEVFEGSRRSGLDVRMPYWDPDLVDFLYRTPPAALTEGGLSKGLVRKMLSRRFPQLGFERHKKVLATNYFTGLIIREGPEVWRKMGGAKALSRAGVIEPERLHSWIREVFEGARPSETARVWNLLSLEVWVRGHARGGGG
jgi:asparagine synthetase B (glutamine-hydrolysing)